MEDDNEEDGTEQGQSWEGDDKEEESGPEWATTRRRIDWGR